MREWCSALLGIGLGNLRLGPAAVTTTSTRPCMLGNYSHSTILKTHEVSPCWLPWTYAAYLPHGDRNVLVTVACISGLVRYSLTLQGFSWSIDSAWYSPISPSIFPIIGFLPVELGLLQSDSPALNTKPKICGSCSCSTTAQK